MECASCNIKNTQRRPKYATLARPCSFDALFRGWGTIEINKTKVESVQLCRLLKLPIIIVQKTATTKYGAEFCQKSIGAIRRSLATLYNEVVWTILLGQCLLLGQYLRVKVLLSWQTHLVTCLKTLTLQKHLFSTNEMRAFWTIS